MKRFLTSGFLIFIFLNASAIDKDSVIHYVLPDSVKAVSFITEIKIGRFDKKRSFTCGIVTDSVSLSLTNHLGKVSFKFYGPSTINNRTSGLNVYHNAKFAEMIFTYKWEIGETQKLMISQATDSIGKFSLCSGYVYLPKENKWKLIGTMKIDGRWKTLQNLKVFYVNRKKQDLSISIDQVWCQRQNGSWKNMLQTNYTPPVVNLYSHIDSTEQLQIDKKLITQAISDNKTDAKQDHNGVYYTIMKEGSGGQVSINDTVVAYYKGYLFKDGVVFDETKDKPATFPLNRLIRGWQIGVPLCRVGGKIKLIIPSNLAYSIRTRSAKIPPNSILVFEIEVVDAKSPL